jgi:hypothetical protein
MEPSRQQKILHGRVGVVTLSTTALTALPTSRTAVVLFERRGRRLEAKTFSTRFRERRSGLWTRQVASGEPYGRILER